MIEQITLHGGPRHGQEMAIPEGHDDLKVDVVLTKSDRTKGTRKGHYTRVHTSAGNPMHDFEWSGYTTPFVPIEV